MGIGRDELRAEQKELELKIEEEQQTCNECKAEFEEVVQTAVDAASDSHKEQRHKAKANVLKRKYKVKNPNMNSNV